MKKFLLLSAAIISGFTVSAQSACQNKDFEDQNFNNWSGNTGTISTGWIPAWTGPMNIGPNNAPLMSSFQHTILTVNALDSIVIDSNTGLPDPYMTALAPSGGTASIRLGNAQVGSLTEKLSYTFTVSPADTIFTYQYAVVLQDPNHIITEQPFFTVKFYDSSNTIIPSLCDTLISTSGYYPFITTTYNAEMLRYKRWSGVSVNLAPWVGQTVTIEFHVADCSLSGHFGYAYIDVSCLGQSIPNVWPGDADYDLTANTVDLLSLGLAYGATGPARPSATTLWQPEASTDWSQYFPLGANYKHADCNGDGVVNANDTTAILQNYNLTHPFRYMQQQYNSSVADLYLVPQQTTIGSHQWGAIDIMLGKSTLPVDSLYGLSFKINYNPATIDTTSAKIVFENSSWLGTMGSDAIEIYKNFGAAGFTDAAITRINHLNAGGYGKIGTFYFFTDSLTPYQSLTFNLSNVAAVTNNKEIIAFNTGNTFMQASSTVGFTAYKFEDIASVYPNPANEFVTVKLHTDVSQVEITDVSGKSIYSTVPSGNTVTIETQHVPAGLYLVRVTSQHGVMVKKLVIKK